MAMVGELLVDIFDFVRLLRDQGSISFRSHNTSKSPFLWGRAMGSAPDSSVQPIPEIEGCND